MDPGCEDGVEFWRPLLWLASTHYGGNFSKFQERNERRDDQDTRGSEQQLLTEQHGTISIG